ncbi:YjcZ family sporulation protein [Bacillus shivajii]|uniref:YjcZ family sporulation protein n=1 Tax=Bacillus shivajii TaxID=1983719 RepID=UPI00299EBB8C|nr:YjcZ family sporulation protein [Bacillus shivajii]
MYSNVNAAPTLGANVPPNVSPMPTEVAPAFGYGYDHGYVAPTYKPNFTLIVVLFILLVIIGACCYYYKDYKDC